MSEEIINAIENTSGTGTDAIVPKEIEKKFNWAAFFGLIYWFFGNLTFSKKEDIYINIPLEDKKITSAEYMNIFSCIILLILSVLFCIALPIMTFLIVFFASVLILAAGLKNKKHIKSGNNILYAKIFGNKLFGFFSVVFALFFQFLLFLFFANTLILNIHSSDIIISLILIIAPVFYGFKGNKILWQAKRFESIEDFNKKQKKQIIYTVIIDIILLIPTTIYIWNTIKHLAKLNG